MIPSASSSAWAAIALLGNHLWQSTVFAAGASLLTLAMRRQRARVRYGLWLAASVKFLVPFAALVALGGQLPWRSARTEPPELTVVMDAMSQPFSPPAPGTAAAFLPAGAPRRAAGAAPLVIVAVWSFGTVMILAGWWLRWRRAAAIVRAASPVRDGRALRTLRRLETAAGITAPIALVAPDAALELGVFGILNPVLLWPAAIGACLADGEVDAIVAHELCHVRRRDNLAAAVHMFAQAVFWFHPLVWWLGARLVDERERACDEDVIRLGHEPLVYADSIVKVCRLYRESPPAWVAGVTGSNLKKRIEGIMTEHAARQLGAGRKLLLAAAGVVAVAAPIAVGVVSAPRLRAQSASPAGPAFDVASIKPAQQKARAATRVTPRGIEYTSFTLRMLIADAYNVKGLSIASADARSRDLLDRDTYDIIAKADREVPRDQLRLMVQTLLADRFKLALHHESKTEAVYKMVVGPGGAKLAESAGEGEPVFAPAPDGGAVCSNMTMAAFSNYLSSRLGRVVLDLTGLRRRYDFILKLDGTPGLNQLRESVASGADPGAAKAAIAAAMNDWSSSSIFTDIQKQLGLKLEADKGPVDTLVIDHLEKATPN